MTRISIGLLLSGMILGSWITCLVVQPPVFFQPAAIPATPVGDSSFPLTYPLKTTLYRFRLNPQNLRVYREWIQWHRDAYRPMVRTLERERMYFESVFRDTVNDPNAIYWLAINGEGGATSSTSDLDIDRKHIEYMKQILVKGSRTTLTTEFVLLPDFIQNSISRHQAAEKSRLPTGVREYAP